MRAGDGRLLYDYFVAPGGRLTATGGAGPARLPLMPTLLWPGWYFAAGARVGVRVRALTLTLTLPPPHVLPSAAAWHTPSRALCRAL